MSRHRTRWANCSPSIARLLERAGYRVEDDLPLALQKDAGIDPGVLAWLLGQFPVEPLPDMIEPLSAEELRAFRDQLRERLRRLAMPEG